MHRIAPDNPVRRRLFPVENLEDQARADNCTNRFKEELSRETIEKSKKWNFDIINEVALEGPYEWYKREGDKFVQMIPVRENFESKRVLPMQVENENTPKSLKDGPALVIRKRKKDFECKKSQAVKRKISFD